MPKPNQGNTTPHCETDAKYAYSLDDIDWISEELGIPWERVKDHPFSPRVRYIGFKWNILSMQVSLGAAKKTKYLNAILAWTQQPTHPLHNVQKLYGKLLHICLVIPRGQAYLTKLETMLCAGHNHPFVPHSSPKGL